MNKEAEKRGARMVTHLRQTGINTIPNRHHFDSLLENTLQPQTESHQIKPRGVAYNSNLTPKHGETR
jgi:hypothetical protein